MAGEKITLSRQAARAQDLKRYFTGKPCKNGHVDERQVVNGVCVSCSKVIQHAFRQKHNARILIRNRQYRQANPEWAKEQTRKSYATNKEHHRAKAKLWRSKNASKVKADKKIWKEENRDHVRALHRNRKARKRQNGGSHNATDIADILRMQKSKCGCCRISLKNKPYHVDHVIPLSKGGSNGRRNLQILCVPCNLSKSKLDPLVFMRSKGKLL